MGPHTSSRTARRWEAGAGRRCRAYRRIAFGAKFLRRFAGVWRNRAADADKSGGGAMGRAGGGMQYESAYGCAQVVRKEIELRRTRRSGGEVGRSEKGRSKAEGAK